MLHNEIRFGTALALGRYRKAWQSIVEDIVNTRNLVLGSVMLLPLLTAKPASAQRVNADIIIGGGPIAGRVIIGDRGRDEYRGRPRPIRRVEWIHARDYRRNDWWRRFERESRVIVVFWDRRDDSYYYDRHHSGLAEIRLYEREGRFYRRDDDRRDGRYDNDRRDVRYEDRRRDDRRDDRRDRKDNRRDDRRDNRRDHRGN